MISRKNKKYFLRKLQNFGFSVGDYITADRLEKTPSFADINLKATYDYRLNGIAMQLSCGVKNVLNSYQKDLDLGAFRDASYIYGPSLPRSFFVGVKFTN